MHIIISAMLFIFTSSTFAAPVKKDFTEQAFQQAQANNQLVLIDVYASWCPTCKKQTKILQEYFTEHPDSTLQVLVVDFDKQKDWVSYFKAPRQSTLLLYRGDKQLWLSVAETNKQRIFDRLLSAEQSTALE